MKKCSKCKGEKDLGEFSKNKSNRDGFSTVCKPCAKMVAKEWRQKNRYDGRIVASKTCSTCQTTKPVEKFWKDISKVDGFAGECKDCIRIYRMKNRDRLLEEQRVRNKRMAEKEKIQVTGRVCSQCKTYKTSDNFWKSKHTSDGLYSCCIVCKKLLESTPKRRSKRYENHKSWVQNNKKHSRDGWNNWDKNKRRTSVEYRLRRNVMHAIVFAVKKHTFDAKLERFKRAIFDHLDYTSEDLKAHIESQWEPWMNWDNYGRYSKDKMTWQIDHKIPQSKLPFESFDDENFQKLWALDNLRPLETVANIKKGNRAA